MDRKLNKSVEKKNVNLHCDKIGPGTSVESSAESAIFGSAKILSTLRLGKIVYLSYLLNLTSGGSHSLNSGPFFNWSFLKNLKYYKVAVHSALQF